MFRKYSTSSISAVCDILTTITGGMVWIFGQIYSVKGHVLLRFLYQWTHLESGEKKKRWKKGFSEVEPIVFNHRNGKSHYCFETKWKKTLQKLVTITAAHHPSAESNKYRACFWGGLTVNYGQDGRAYNLLSNWVHLAYLWLNRHPVGPWIHWEELWFWRRLSLAIYGFIKGL